MNHQISYCQPEKLPDLLAGSLSDIESDAMLGHLEQCVRCQTRLNGMAAQDEQWDKARQILSESKGPEFSKHAAASDPSTCEFPLRHDRQPNWTESLSKKLLAPASHPELLGRIGRYDVERFVGSGGMGIVFKGYDTELNRPVAIKVLAPSLAFNGTARQRFAREARAAAAVVHEHVVSIYNVESNGELPFLVMHFAQGESLQARLDRVGPLELKQILRIGKQIAAGLAAAHAQGLIHRDVKPANVLIEEGIDRALITDFGLAQTADDASLTCSGFLPGTPQYMSPEQARGEKLNPSSDLFSTGSVLYAMCTGRPPFRAESSLGVLRKINEQEPKSIRELNPDIPAWFCRIVEKLMSKRPDDRYASAHELAQILEACLAHVQQPLHSQLPVSLRMPSIISGVRDRLRRHPFRVTVGLLLLATVGFAVWPKTIADSPTNPPVSPEIFPAPLAEAPAAEGSVKQTPADSSTTSTQTPEPIVWRGEPLPRTPQDDIRAKLDQRTTVAWDSVQFETAVKELLSSINVEYDIRRPANEGTEAAEEKLISLHMTGSRREILKRLLRSRQLTYLVHESNLEFAQPEYTDQHPTLHRYDLSHLCTNSQAALEIKNIIEQVIAPNQWTFNGGNCSLGLIGPVLNVRATESMHEEIAQLLTRIAK